MADPIIRDPIKRRALYKKVKYWEFEYNNFDYHKFGSKMFKYSLKVLSFNNENYECDDDSLKCCETDIVKHLNVKPVVFESHASLHFVF